MINLLKETQTQTREDFPDNRVVLKDVPVNHVFVVLDDDYGDNYYYIRIRDGVFDCSDRNDLFRPGTKSYTKENVVFGLFLPVDFAFAQFEVAMLPSNMKVYDLGKVSSMVTG